MTGADILLADDDQTVRNGLSRQLEAEGFSVRSARHGEEALALFRERRPDLLLLDIDMPRLNGFAVCTMVRQADPTVPILFLTANASEENEVCAFGCGADDFFDKTDAPQLVMARLRRALVRADGAEASAGVLTLGSVRVNVTGQSVTDGSSSEHLTSTEAGILRALAAARGRWLSKEDLIAALRGAGFACEDGLVYTHVSRLRRKLGSAAGFLLSERGSGYCLRDA